VSAVIGSRPYEFFAEEYQRPVVIAGFEPLDVMQAIDMLVQQLNAGGARVENQFTRGVTREGNRKAQALVAEVFELRPNLEWRGSASSRIAVCESSPRTRNSMRAPLFAGGPTVAENAACQCRRSFAASRSLPTARSSAPSAAPRDPIGSCMVSGKVLARPITSTAAE